MWDPVSGKSRGFGFAAFRDKTDAEQAIATMNGEWLGTRAIRCNWATQKGKLHTYGLPTTNRCYLPTNQDKPPLPLLSPDSNCLTKSQYTKLLPMSQAFTLAIYNLKPLVRKRNKWKDGWV
jgi:RNA recognition motif-containing protein